MAPIVTIEPNAESPITHANRRNVMRRISRNETSSNAEHELFFLGQRPHLENTVSTMNPNVLNGRFKCSDIFPLVKLDLLRDQDRNNSERAKMAQHVAIKMAGSLAEAFTGEETHNSKLVLRVNVTVVYNGLYVSKANDRIKGVFGRGTTKGRGLPNLRYLTVSIFETGAVAVARQLSSSDGCRCGDKTCQAGGNTSVLWEL
jgi:hypothetical protein